MIPAADIRFFGLEDVGMVLVRGAKEAGDVLAGDGLKRAYDLGASAAQAGPRRP